MFSIIIALIFLMFFIVAPLRTKIVLFLINSVLPDPIPYVDEVIMCANILSNIIKAINIVEYLSEHKFIAAMLGISSVLAIVGLIYFL